MEISKIVPEAALAKDSEGSRENLEENGVPARGFFRKKIFPWLALSLISSAFVVFFYAFLSPEIFADSNLRSLVKFLICASWMTLFFGWISLFPSWFRAIFLAIFFIPSAFFGYVFCVFKMPYSYGLVADIAETNFEEALSFLSVSAALALVFYVFAISIFGVFLGKIRPSFPRRKVLFFAAPAVLIFANFLPEISRGIVPIARVSAFVFDLNVYRENDFGVVREISRLEKSRVFVEKIRENSPLIFFHFGESARADHASFNGYERETFPKIHEEFRRGNVISFPKCVSFAASTRLSAFGILTPAKVLSPAISAGTFIPFLNASGMKTFGFFTSMPAGGNYYDSALTSLTNEISEKFFTKKRSDTILGNVKKALENEHGNAFFFYYGEGSHVPAVRYNRDKYSVFVPAAAEFVENETRINAYDNCLVATDDFVANAIEALKDKNAVYIYVSDHGEMLGEDNFWSRNPLCYRRKELRHVLFFVWASKKFQSENAELWANLKENRARLGVISHDFVYHSILNLAGIRNEFYDETNDLFSKNALPFLTEMPAATEFGVLRFENGIEWKDLPKDASKAEKQRRSREARQQKNGD